MAGLFGSAPAAASAANTLGDLSKDIALNNPPEDSISHIAFSPVSNHLAVASWDKKVRIYEVNAQGGEGKALFEHEAPVLSCDWSKVWLRNLCSEEHELTEHRMVRRLLVLEQTRPRACLTSVQEELQLHRSPPMMLLFVAFASSRLVDRQWL